MLIIKKHLMLFFSLLKIKNNSYISLLLFLPCKDNIVRKCLAKSQGFTKNIKRGMAIYGGEEGGVYLLHCDIERLKGATLEP